MIIRNALLSTAAFAAFASGSAFAADLPSRAAPAPYLAPAPIFTWTGFYVGLNAGVAFNSRGNNNVAAPVGFGGAGPIAANTFGNGFGGNRNSGFTGGATVGYNWQAGALVYGLEADFNYIDRNRSGNNNAAFVAPAGGFAAGTVFAIQNGNNGSNDNFLGTVRGRLGYAADRALFFVTGGFAYGGGNSNSSTIQTFTTPVGGIAAGAALPPVGLVSTATYVRSSSRNNIGYTIGAGVEYAFTNNWTAKLEYDYISNGKRGGSTYVPVTVGAPAGTYFVGSRRSNDLSRVIVGVNYKF